MLALNQWKAPELKVLDGKYCTLEPLEEKHYADLHRVRCVPDESTRYQYLLNCPPLDWELFKIYMDKLRTTTDRIAYAVIDKASGTAEGLQCFLNINPTYGSIEIGGILWGPNIARSRITTEAFYLCSVYALDELHYRRYEWKCNNENNGSKNAAIRFGFQFEGILRSNLIQNGRNRDTAYFSILDTEWPVIRDALKSWLDEENFDDQGRQKTALSVQRKHLPL